MLTVSLFIHLLELKKQLYNRMGNNSRSQNSRLWVTREAALRLKDGWFDSLDGQGNVWVGGVNEQRFYFHLHPWLKNHWAKN